MNWFAGEVSGAIQKAIGEKKVFIVFVKDDNENSAKMEELWNEDQIAEVCTDDKCVAISISAGSVPGQQFGAIYPILCVPSTYLINNQGIPTDIIPGVVQKDEFIKRLQDAIDKTFSPASPEVSATDENSASEDGGVCVEEATALNSTVESVDQGDTGNVSCEGLNEDLEAELTPQEKTQIEMLREKLKLKREEEEKKKLKEIEQKRRETGAELQVAQRDLAEKQAMKLAKEIADRKSEDKAAREKVREQIRQDRLEKTERFDKEKQERQDVSRKKTEASASASATEAEKKKADLSNTSRILFRLPDGSSVSNTFNSDATFFLAETFIKEHLHWDRVRLTTVYPKHEFTSDDMLQSFRELGLVPNASIIVSTARSETTNKSLVSSNPASIVWSIFAPIFAIFIAILNWFGSLFTSGSRNNENQPTQETTPSYSSPTNNRDDSVRRRNIPRETSSRSNMQRLRRDEDDDENATWNGNSTQQM